jgi:hypothetical protein
MSRATPGSRPSTRAAAAIASLALALAVVGEAAGRPYAAPAPHASAAATRRCLLELGVSASLVPARAAIGPEGDLSFRFPSGRRGRLSFFHTPAAAKHRTAADAAKARAAKTPAPYRVLNVEVGWAAKPGPPSVTEKAVLGRCIIQRGTPTPG